MCLKLPPDKQAFTAFYWLTNPTGIFLSSMIAFTLDHRPWTPDPGQPGPWTAWTLDSLASPWTAWTLDSLATPLTLDPWQPVFTLEILAFTLDSLDTGQLGFTLDSLDTGQPGVTLDPGQPGHPGLHVQWKRLIQKQDSVITKIISKPRLSKYDTEYLNATRYHRANLISLGISIQLNVSL